MKTKTTHHMLLACVASACFLSGAATAGVLVGNQAIAPAAVDLTAEGNLDWTHWGLATPTDFDQKSPVVNEISNFTAISGDGSEVSQFGNAATAFSWTDGTPTAGIDGTTTGVYISGLDNGFEFTVAADTTTKFLRVYAGGWNSRVHVEATLSDGGGTEYVDESLDDYGVGTADVHTIKFAADSAGQTLTVRVYSIVMHGGGNCTLMGASLGSPPPGPTVMGVGTQVQNVNAYSGSEASFNFAVTNNASPMVPSSYRWYKNGLLATNVTGSYFTFLAAPTDDGAKVYCVASLPEVFNPNHLPSLTSATGTVKVLTGVTYTNGLKVEFFPGAIRPDVEAGNVGPATDISRASSFEMPVNDGRANYARRVSGYFIPPASGDYVFFISSDDDADLFLSEDSASGHKRLIAQEENWSSSRQWVSSDGNSSLSQKRSDQWSPDQGATTPFAGGIRLAGGQGYYLECVQHQGTGGDGLAATYKLISDADPLDGDAPVFGEANSNVALMTGPTTALSWVTQPASMTNFVGRTITLSSKATSDSEFLPLYRWFRNNSVVSNATAGTYSFPALLEDDKSQWYVTASTVEGGLSITSAVVTLTIKPVTFPQGQITFEDQDPAGLDQSGMMSPNPYTDAEGLPTGVTATFYNFNSWNADPQQTPGGTWLLYGDNTLPGDASLTFNMPVQVPSFWVTTGPYGNLGSSLKAYLKGIEQFAYTNTAFFTLTEVTNGESLLIDSIVFSDYVGSEIDDITIAKPTTLISFSTQVGNDGPANPNPYTAAQGLFPGVTATFDQFNNWNGSTDHTPDTTDNYLLYGANYNVGGVSSITFNTPVEVPTLWVNHQGDGSLGAASLTGSLKGQVQFTSPVTLGTWAEVTAGAGLPIDTLRFTNYGDSWIDDITVNAITNPPAQANPARLSLVKVAGGGLTLSWTGQARLEESAVPTSGWTTSANQGNPQSVTPTTGAKFYRMVNP